MTTLVFALVHYENASAIRAALERLRSMVLPAEWSIEAVVADNSANAPTDLPAPVLRLESNRGYLGGGAAVLKAWRSSHGTFPDWFVLANPDVAFSNDAIAALASTPLADDVGLVAPTILLGGTVPQNPFLRFRPARFRMRFYTVAYRSGALTAALDVLLHVKRRLSQTKPRLSEGSHPIYAPHGSALFCHRRFFERGGTLDYRAFMYGEEIHLAEQARALGLRVLYVPSITAVHGGGDTTSLIESRQRREWHRASADVLWNDYFR